MLVLSRKTSESIIIGDNIAVTIVRIGGDFVKIGIDAPKNVNIRREELGKWTERKHEAALPTEGR